jgi:hypothetical protein
METEEGTAPAVSPATGQAQATVPAPMAEMGSYAMLPSSTSGARILLGADIEIHSDKLLDAFSNAETQAFAARHNQAQGDQIALLCRSSRVPRITSIGSYKAIRNTSVQKLHDAGIVYWPAEKRQRLALVFDKPQGSKLLEAPDGKPMTMNEDRIISALVMPVVSALMEFDNAGIVHGALSLDNLYLPGPQGTDTVLIGECLSTAASFRLHPVYCTIPRGMAQVSGRGEGTIQEDLYALGICVAMVARGVNLMNGRTARQAVMDKIAEGSFMFATGGERMHGGLSEFLRGVLNDDPRQRWTLDEALRWVEGRRIPGKAQNLQIRATRPFVFREEKYWDLRSIAYAFSEYIPEAAAALEKDNFDLWVKRNFDDTVLNERLEKIRHREKNSSREKLVSAVCMALDPRAPVRFRDVSVMPEGFGTALAEVMARDGDVQNYAEIISMQLVNNWASEIFDELPDASSTISRFEKCRNFLVQKMPVYGIERVLYMLNKEVCCLSPVLKNYVVFGPGGLLLALEDLSRRSDRPQEMLDRHMMAFISVREPKMIDPHLGHVISRDRGYQLIGISRTLAAIQKRFSTGPVPGVGNWLISLINPAIDRFYDRDLRQEMKRRMGKLNDSGDLQAILDLIDNLQLVREDMQRFAQARNEYAYLLREQTQLSNQLERRATFGRATGRNVAMMVSALLASCSIMIYLFMRLMEG